MSFDLSVYRELQAVKASEAKDFLGTSRCRAPECVKDFVSLGIDALVHRYGQNIHVTVVGRGHLSSGDDFDISSIDGLMVKRADTAG